MADARTYRPNPARVRRAFREFREAVRKDIEAGRIVVPPLKEHCKDDEIGEQWVITDVLPLRETHRFRDGED